MADKKSLKNKVFRDKKPSLGSKLVMGVFITAVALVSVAFVTNMLANRNKTTVDSAVYQAVVLTNGQAYFGRLSNENDDFVTLTDVYYLQQAQQEDQAQPTTEEKKDQPQLQLTRLGSEIHGPQNQMFISEDNIAIGKILNRTAKLLKLSKNTALTPNLKPATVQTLASYEKSKLNRFLHQSKKTNQVYKIAPSFCKVCLSGAMAVSAL